MHRQVVRKELARRAFEIDPVVRLHYVQVAPPVLASPRGDLARLKDALAAEWGLTDLEADLQVIRALPAALEAGSFGVTVAVHEERASSPRSGPASTSAPLASPWTSARRPSPATSSTCPTARCSPRAAS